MDSRDITVRRQRGRRTTAAPGSGSTTASSDVTVRGNRVHDNDEDGIFFEIIQRRLDRRQQGLEQRVRASRAWGFGAGILISSSDGADDHRATPSPRTPAGSASSARRANLSPHTGNVISDNVVIYEGRRPFVTGFYDDHGGSLFTSGNGNGGVRQPLLDRRASRRPTGSTGTVRSHASRDYNGTAGEEGASYLSTAEKNAVLAAAGDLRDPVSAPLPSLWFRPGAQLTTSRLDPGQDRLEGDLGRDPLPGPDAPGRRVVGRPSRCPDSQVARGQRRPGSRSPLRDPPAGAGRVRDLDGVAQRSAGDLEATRRRRRELRLERPLGRPKSVPARSAAWSRRPGRRAPA